MEIEYFGSNCFRVKTKGTTIVVDDTLEKQGGKCITDDKTALFYTQAGFREDKAADAARLIIDTPGEFEVGDVTVHGVATRAHIDEDSTSNAIVYQFTWSGQTVTVLGHIHPDLSDEVLELTTGTDVLIVPVGGNGFTLDPVGANAAIKKIEPNVVIPSQYDIKGLTYEVPAQPLEEFLKTLSMNKEEVQESYKLTKTNEEISTQTTLVELKVKKK